MVTRAELDAILDTAEPPGLVTVAMGVAIVDARAEALDDAHLAELLVGHGFTAAEVEAHMAGARNEAALVVLKHGQMEG